jgi:integrase
MPRGRPRQEPKLVERGERGWWIQYFDEPTGETKRRATGTRERGAADRIFENWKKGWDANQADQRAEATGTTSKRPRHPDEITIAEVLTIYNKTHAPKLASPERIGYAQRRLLAWWEDARVSAILPVVCDQYCEHRVAQGAKLGTVTRELAILRAAVLWCEKNGKLIRGQAPFVQVPGRQPGKDRWLTRNEAARLLRDARKEPKSRLHLPLFILLGLYTGARSGAILALRWPQIDLVRGTIDFNEPGRPITNKRRAKIQIPQRLKCFLIRAQRRATGPWVISYQGEPVKRIKHSFAAACVRAGLTDVTPHTLRHTCGTWLAQRGVPIWEIAGWLGHSHHDTVELYAHHHPNHLANARDALDRRERNGTQL